MNQKIIPIASAGIGLIAFALTHQYLKSQWQQVQEELDRIRAGAQKIEIVVADTDIPQGTTLQRSDLAKKTVYERDVSVRGHVVLAADANLILGRQTMFSIQRKEALFWSDIEGGAQAGMGLAYMVKPGLRALSLAVSGAEAVSGMVEPNDRLDILGTFSFPSKTVPGEMETVTLTVLQDVTVLATGTQMSRQAAGALLGSRRAGYNSVTLEVTPREAELLVFAQQMKGRLTLALRNPGDLSFKKDLPEIDFHLLQTELPELNLIRQRDIRHKKNP